LLRIVSNVSTGAVVPPLPPEITDIEVARPVSQEKVLLTPVKLKEFIDLHAPSGGTTAPVETFETILNNLRPLLT
jgi:hypothetical protein